MIPKKYPQNLHTPKIIHFSETPKNNEIQNFESPKMPRAYVCMNISGASVYEFVLIVFYYATSEGCNEQSL